MCSTYADEPSRIYNNIKWEQFPYIDMRWGCHDANDDAHIPVFVTMPCSTISAIPSKFSVKLGRWRLSRKPLFATAKVTLERT